MSEKLKTLNEVLQGELKDKPSSSKPSESKEENKDKKEEQKNEEKKVEEEEDRNDDDSREVKEEKVEAEGKGEKKPEEKKAEDNQEKKKEEPKKPKEPEPKIPTDFSAFINEVSELKKAGNDFFKKNEYDNAIEKYKEACDKLEKDLSKINKERSYNNQSEELLTFYKQIMSNLSACYMKQKNYQEVEKIDVKIISIDPKYDKSYVRLFYAYKELNKREQAVYFGDILLKNFDQETKDKYKDDIPKIEAEKKSLEAEYAKIRALKRKETIKKVSKYAVPVLILVAAVAIYFFVFKKKQIAK